MAFLEHAWAFLTDSANREILTWLGGGLVVALGGLWSGFIYFRSGSAAEKAGSLPPAIAANHGIAAGRDITGSTISVSGARPSDDATRQRQAGAGDLSRCGEDGER